MKSIFSKSQIYALGEDQTPGLECTGDNKRHIWVVHTADSGANEMELLEKIFLAVGLDLSSDICCVSLPDRCPLSIRTLVGSDPNPSIFLFGVAPARAGLQIDAAYYQPVHLGSYQVLLAHTLVEIDSNKKYKAALWAALQQMYKTQ